MWKHYGHVAQRDEEIQHATENVWRMEIESESDNSNVRAHREWVFRAD